MIEAATYIGHNNSFSLKIWRGESLETAAPLSLSAITQWKLVLRGGEEIDDQSIFNPKYDENILEIVAGPHLTLDHLGSHKAHLVAYTHENPLGVRLPDFKLKVLS